MKIRIRKTVLLKILVLFIIPLILALYLFWPKTIELSVENSSDTETPVLHIPDFEKLNEKGGLGRSLRTILSAPFDLKYYVITIKDDSIVEDPAQIPIFDFFASIGDLDSRYKIKDEAKLILFTEKAQDIPIKTGIVFKYLFS